MRTAARTFDVSAAALMSGRFGTLLFAAPTAFAPIFAFALVSAVVASAKVIKEHKTPPVVYVHPFEVRSYITVYVPTG